MERLEERFIEKEINAELNNKFSDKYKAEKLEIEENLMEARKQVSNLEEGVDLTLDFAAKMAPEWHSADYLAKQQIQFLLFPDGITYNKKTDSC